jgi:hypothetical protein
MNKDLHAVVLNALYEISVFFARSSVPYRIVFFTDPDNYKLSNKSGADMYDITLGKN